MLNGACGAGVLDVRYQVYGQLMQGQLDNFDPWYWSLRLLALVPRNSQNSWRTLTPGPRRRRPPKALLAFRRYVGRRTATAGSFFRSFQGWLALSPQGPGDGGLEVPPCGAAE